ncbi:glycosyltransferase family 28 protein [Cucumis melo var. makuwa]|uniref:Glycosyltransferase family 28 protein n=1 Tax=Cucumis melo var. makuwa TaxID=1194695 RepID=A0A5A7U611_CUCMM|nr:glycosyltransferase family 28 protein [Cucumis melo var. makuwa]
MRDRSSVWDCGSPLYDSYELASLAHLIDRNLLAFPPPYHAGSRRITSNKVSHFHFSPFIPPPPPSAVNGSFKKKPPAVDELIKNKIKKLKSTFRFSSISSGFGFWRKKQIQV